MKTTYYFVFFLFLTGLLFSSCEKNNITTDEPTLSLNGIFSDMEYVKNPIEIKKYIKVPGDQDEEQINQQVYQIGLAAREVLKDKTYNEIIFAKANNAANSCMDLREFSKNESLKSANKDFMEFVKVIESAKLTHISTNPLKSGVLETYIPAIFIPNLAVADLKLRPIICPGIDVNSELPGMEKYED